MVELIYLLLFRDLYADAVDLEEVAIAVFTVDAFLLQHLALGTKDESGISDLLDPFRQDI